MDNWTKFEDSIKKRLDSFERGTIWDFYYEPGSFPHVDAMGNNVYQPPSLDELRRDIKILYNESVNENYYWQFCKFQTYKNTFKERFKNYQQELPEAEISDFVDEEIKLIQRQGLRYHEHRLNVICDNQTFKKIKFTQNKKIKFLEAYHDNDELNIPVFYTIFNEKQLEIIWKRSREAGLIECRNKDFMYWFTGIGEKGSNIKWTKLLYKGSPHKSALFWYMQKLNPEANETVINRSGIFKTKVSRKNIQYKPSDKEEKIFDFPED